MSKKKMSENKPRLRFEIQPLAHYSRVFIEPAADDWWSEEVDISRFVQSVEIDARVGNATTAVIRTIMVGGDAYVSEPPLSQERARPWWRIW